MFRQCCNNLRQPTNVHAVAALLKTVDCILLQLEIPLKTVYYTFTFARKTGIRCIVTPAPAQPIEMSGLAGLDYFIPNESDAEAVTKMPVRTPDDAKQDAANLIASGWSAVILTRGSKRSVLASRQSLEQT